MKKGLVIEASTHVGPDSWRASVHKLRKGLFVCVEEHFKTNCDGVKERTALYSAAYQCLSAASDDFHERINTLLG